MKQGEIIQHIRNFSNSGVIPDELIPFYDQHGKWKGDRIRWRTPIPKSLLTSIRRSYLSESRRYGRSRGGAILLTSWYVRSEDESRIPFAEIRGSLIAHASWPLQALTLRLIGGHFLGHTKHRIDLPNLVRVGGCFESPDAFCLHAPRLRTAGGWLKVAGAVPPKLQKVRGSLSTFWCFDFKAPRLLSVGGALIPHKAKSVDAPLLEYIGGGFLLGDTTKQINTPKLLTVGDDFYAGSAELIWAHRLRKVGGDLDTRSDPQFYHPAIRVTGEWFCNSAAIHYWVARTKALEALKGRDCDLEL